MRTEAYTLRLNTGSDIIDIQAGLNDNQRERYLRDYPEQVDAMSSVAECFCQDGLKQVRQQGETRKPVRLLRAEIRHNLPEAVHKRIEQANESTPLWGSRA